MVDAPAVEWIEIDLADVGANQRPAGRRQDQLAALTRDARLDPGRAWRGFDQPLDLLTPRFGQGRCALAHRQGQRQGHRLGHAHLVAAHQEQHVRRQGQHFARPRRGRHMDRYGQEHRARIAVVHQAHQPLAAGQGPQDRIGAHPDGQGPDQAGRTAAVARIAPIGVPAGRNLLAHRHPGRRTGRDPLRHRDQFGLDPLGPLRPEGDDARWLALHRLGDGRRNARQTEQ